MKISLNLSTKITNTEKYIDFVGEKTNKNNKYKIS